MAQPSLLRFLVIQVGNRRFYMKKILVIEDDAALRYDLLEALILEAYDAIGAENGQEGVLLAQEHIPHLVLCDINMPILDGFGVIEQLRQNQHTAGVPVIILSAQGEDHFVQRALQLGAVAYLSKPYMLSKLLAAIKSQIGY